MRAPRRAMATLVFWAAASCSEANRQTYGEAAVATGVTLAAVGVNRAVTNDCWAYCTPGYACNQRSGLCERGECLPPCEYGSQCVRDPLGDVHCVWNARDAGVVSDAGPADAGPADAALVLDGGH